MIKIGVGLYEGRDSAGLLSPAIFSRRTVLTLTRLSVNLEWTCSSRRHHSTFLRRRCGPPLWFCVSYVSLGESATMATLFLDKILILNENLNQKKKKKTQRILTSFFWKPCSVKQPGTKWVLYQHSLNSIGEQRLPRAQARGDGLYHGLQDMQFSDSADFKHSAFIYVW